MALVAPQKAQELPQMLMGQPKLTLWDLVGAYPFSTPSSQDGSVWIHPCTQGLLHLTSLRQDQSWAPHGSSAPIPPLPTPNTFCESPAFPPSPELQPQDAGRDKAQLMLPDAAFLPPDSINYDLF